MPFYFISIKGNKNQAPVPAHSLPFPFNCAAYCAKYLSRFKGSILSRNGNERTGITGIYWLIKGLTLRFRGYWNEIVAQLNWEHPIADLGVRVSNPPCLAQQGVTPCYFLRVQREGFPDCSPRFSRRWCHTTSKVWNQFLRRWLTKASLEKLPEKASTNINNFNTFKRAPDFRSFFSCNIRIMI